MADRLAMCRRRGRERHPERAQALTVRRCRLPSGAGPRPEAQFDNDAVDTGHAEAIEANFTGYGFCQDSCRPATSTALSPQTFCRPALGAPACSFQKVPATKSPKKIRTTDYGQGSKPLLRRVQAALEVCPPAATPRAEFPAGLT